jgi:hypothetical protein
MLAPPPPVLPNNDARRAKAVQVNKQLVDILTRILETVAKSRRRDGARSVGPALMNDKPDQKSDGVLSPKDYLVLLPALASAIALTYDVGYFFALDVSYFTFFSLSEHIVRTGKTAAGLKRTRALTEPTKQCPLSPPPHQLPTKNTSIDLRKFRLTTRAERLSP